MPSSSFILASDIVPTFYGKRVWPGCPSKEKEDCKSVKQDWVYPESMILHMAKNPSSPEVYQKMIQCCKEFFEINPVIVVSKLEARNDDGDSRFCSNDFECDKNIAKISSKFWITDKLIVMDGPKNYTSVLCSKIHRCDINYLSICDKVIMFEDLQILTSSVKKVVLLYNKITFHDGQPVLLNKIIECSSTSTEFDM
uniref:Uncharacterized protein n=1 Tax=Panagrolaimus davidi TaxID=227884 RepID=A0A914QS39_9BILA